MNLWLGTACRQTTRGQFFLEVKNVWFSSSRGLSSRGPQNMLMILDGLRLIFLRSWQIRGEPPKWFIKLKGFSLFFETKMRNCGEWFTSKIAPFFGRLQKRATKYSTIMPGFINSWPWIMGMIKNFDIILELHSTQYIKLLLQSSPKVDAHLIKIKCQTSSLQSRLRICS